MVNARITLKLYTITGVTSTETLTAASSANVTFSFSHTYVLPNYFGTFSEGIGTSASTILTSVMTIDYDAATVTFSAARTGSITCSSYSYYAWDYSKDRQLERMINSASDIISKYCNRRFIADTYSEFYRGLGQQKLVLRYFPVNKITSVKVASSSLTAGVDYVTADSTYLEKGYLVKENGWTTYGYETGLVPELTAPVDNIEVVYSAGYTLSTLPFAIEDAALNLVASSYNGEDFGNYGLTSLKQGNVSYSWKDNISSSVLASLDAFKRGVF